jgi:hypothetical protein
MKRFVLLSFVIAFVLFIHPVNAQPASTQEPNGAQLLAECQVAAKGIPKAPEDAVEFGKGMHCFGYLSGVADTYVFWKQINDSQKANMFVPACIPEEATNFELAKVVVKYLNDHPNQIHKSYRLLVGLAFENAYPCQK